MTPVAMVDLAAQRARLGGRVERAMARVLAHGRFVMGPEVFELEERLAGDRDVRHAISCSSGTDALLLALLAVGAGPGDAVFLPAFTFAATAEVVALAGATPVFVDVDPATYNLDSASLESAIAGLHPGLRPVGVIAVDLFGQPADYERVGVVAAAAGMWVLSDAAQSFGSTLQGRPMGTLAAVTATSFFPTKPLGCYGDGGAVFTADDDLADRMRSLRTHGRGEHPYDHRLIGINGRLDTIQAAVLLQKLDIIDDELAARRRLAERYDDALGGLVTLPTIAAGARSAWAQYTIQVDDRDALARHLAEQGVATAVHYPLPVPHQPAYVRFPVVPGGVPVADALATRVLSIPVHPYLSEADQDRVVSAIRDARLAAAGRTIR